MSGNERIQPSSFFKQAFYFKNDDPLSTYTLPGQFVENTEEELIEIAKQRRKRILTGLLCGLAVIAVIVLSAVIWKSASKWK